MLHPDSRCDAVSRVETAIAFPRHGELQLTYSITGAIEDVQVPPQAGSGRADELWRTTCFELFVRTTNDNGYWEFNFSPSSQWAAYRFDAYRSGRSDEKEVAVRIQPRAGREHFELSVRLAFDHPGLAACERSCRLGLSAIIEETSGRNSYWALAHPPGDPDFHHPSSFALDLQRASRS